jgi:excisionase family DNA binding protein
MNPLLTLNEVAAELAISAISVRREVWRRRLAAHRVGGMLRFSRSDLDEYLRSTREKPLRPKPRKKKSLVS